MEAAEGNDLLMRKYRFMEKLIEKTPATMHRLSPAYLAQQEQQQKQQMDAEWGERVERQTKVRAEYLARFAERDAAVARVTAQVTLQADTERGAVIIPEAGVEHKIDRSFDMDQAIAMARKTLCRQAMMIGAESDSLETSITEKQVFNMIRGYRTVGRNIRLKMSITPGLIPQWKRSL